MNSAYFREQQRYTFIEIKNDLSIKEDECKELIKRLKSYGILKTVRAEPSELNLTEIYNEEIEVLEEGIDSELIYYVFKYVGIVAIKNCICICYPKYINKSLQPEGEMKQILNVIKKYDSEEQVINLYNGQSNEKEFNYLAIILFLINDYYLNGIYSNKQDIIEVNGEGEILWDKTINETFAFVSNNKPYYLEVYTKEIVEDEFDYFTNLHKCILTESFQLIKDCKLASLLEIEEISLYEGVIEDFGDKEYILYRIERELSVQFMTQKQIILKTLYTYIKNRKSSEYGLGISFYGTNSFNLVWEKVCASVLDNKLNTKINNLPLNLCKKYEFKRQMTLAEIIEKPKWKVCKKDGQIISRESSKTLIPDLISIVKMGNNFGFIIFDAKYYILSFNKGMVYNNPGVGDVTKQYLYQLAYSDFIKSNGYKFIANSFLFPTEDLEIKCVGQAEMNMLSSITENELKNIELINLPATEVYDLYLNNKLYDIRKILNQINISQTKFELEKYLYKDISEAILNSAIYEIDKLSLVEEMMKEDENLKYQVHVAIEKISTLIRNVNINKETKIKEVRDIISSHILTEQFFSQQDVDKMLVETILEKYIR